MRYQIGVTTAMVVALLTSGLHAPASAAVDEVPIDHAALAEQLFGGVVENRTNEPDQIVTLALSAEFLEWRRLNPAATPDAARSQLDGRLKSVGALSPADRELPESDLLLRLLGSMTTGTGSSTIRAPHVKAFISALGGEHVESWDSRLEFATGAFRHGQWQRSRDEVQAAVWRDVRRKAIADSTFAHAWNSVLGAPIGLDATASLAVMMADPGLNSHANLNAVLALRADPAAFAAEAQRQIDEIVKKTLADAEKARAAAKALVEHCVAKPETPGCTEVLREKAKKDNEELQKTLENYKTGLGAVAKLIDFIDPSSSKKLKTIGEAHITIVSAISKYIAAVAGRGQLGALFSFATLSMTGNIAGAVMSVIGLLGTPQPSIDQIILQQVNALRQQVRQLALEMRENFARVEGQLNNIYANMMAEFDKVNAAVIGNTVQLTSIQRAVAQQGLRLEEIAATILTAIGDVSLHPAVSAINTYIGYAETFNQEIPTFSEYIGPESEFHLAATDKSNDLAFVVPQSTADNQSVDPATVLNEFGEARSINYLARLASKRDAGVTDPIIPVGNPAVWNLGAKAYSVLQLQNPNYATQVNVARTNQIQGEGERIQALAQSFGRPATQSDPSAGFVNPLFRSLIADYNSGVGQLATALRNLRLNEIQVRHEPDGNGVQHKVAKSYNLFWDVDQPIPTVPARADEAQIAHCTNTSAGAVARPSNITYAPISAIVKFADYAYTTRTSTQPPGSGAKENAELAHCYQPSWQTTNIVPGPGGTTRIYGKLRLTVHTRFRLSPAHPWHNLRTAAYTWSDEQQIELRCTVLNCGWRKTAEEGLAEKWPAQAPTFAANAVITTNSTQEDAITTAMRGFVQSRQAIMYQLADTAIDTPGTPLHAAVKQMNTAGRLLQAYTRLGLPIALETDDVMSALLFGQFPIPSNALEDPHISGAYQLASANYACTQLPCAVDPLRPLRGQPRLEIPCDTAGMANLPGDPLGDCLIASATKRINALLERYKVHAQRLAQQAYAEHLPWITNTQRSLTLTDRLVRAPS